MVQSKFAITGLLICFFIGCALVWLDSFPAENHRDSTAFQVKKNLGLDLNTLKDSLTLVPLAGRGLPFVQSYEIHPGLDASTDVYFPSNQEAEHRLLELFDNGSMVQNYEIIPQTSGVYRVNWDTTYAPFGPHRLQVRFCFDVYHPFDNIKVFGPEKTETVFNMVYWPPRHGGLDAKSATVFGFLREKSASYKIEIFDTNNSLLKTIMGRTDNGVIEESWNLRTDHGEFRSDNDMDAMVLIWTNREDSDISAPSKANHVFGPYHYHLSR